MKEIIYIYIYIERMKEIIGTLEEQSITYEKI